MGADKAHRIVQILHPTRDLSTEVRATHTWPVLGILKRLFGESPNAAAAHALYSVLAVQARQVAFYTAPISVPDTLDGRFEVIAVHGFLVMHRLKAAGPAAAGCSQTLYDLMFKHMDLSVRDLGSSDIRTGPRVRKMSNAFMGRVHAYDQAMAAPPPALEDALKRNLYRNEVPNAEALALVAEYMRREAGALAARDTAAMMAGEVRFGPPPGMP